MQAQAGVYYQPLETEPSSGCCPQCLAEWLHSTKQIIFHESFFQIYMSIMYRDRAEGHCLSLKAFFFLIAKTHEMRLTERAHEIVFDAT